MSSQSPSNGSSQGEGADPLCPEDELLVAYLDGELDPGNISQVESQLASDPALQQKLEELRATWDLLEELPPATPNPKFAQSTIEMVALSRVALTPDKSGVRWMRLIWASALVLLPLAFIAGVLAVRQSQRMAERKALEDLHVLVDWDAFKAVGSYDWLEKVRGVKDLDRVVKRPANGVELASGLVPATLDERREWIGGLSGTSRDRLSANLEEFKRIEADDRQRIVELAKRIYQGPDPLGDLQAARDYAHFLADMSISDRVTHSEQQDDAQRLDDLTRRVNRKMVEVYTRELTADSPDRQAVQQWLEEMTELHGDTLPRGGVMGVMADLARRSAFGDSVISEEELDDLLASLSPEAQSIIGRLRSKEAQHAALILYFVTDANQMFPGFGGRRIVDRGQLSKRYDEETARRKALIEFLSPDEAQRELGMTPAGGRGPGRGFGGPGSGFNPPPRGSRNQIREDALQRTEEAKDATK